MLVGVFAWEQGAQRFGITDTLEQFSKRRVEELPKRVAMYKRKQIEILKQAKQIVVPSEYLKKIVMSWGIPEAKISVVYNSFEKIEIKESREELRKKFGWENKKVVISAGRDVPWKGFDLLRDVVAEIEGLELFIAHTLPQQELRERIKAADLFVLNTGYEGLSHQLLEVMSIGTPIITTRVGGNPELIVDGAEGVFVAYNDGVALGEAIKNFLHSPEKFQTMAHNAQKKAHNFSIDRMIGEFVKIVRSIV